ncbi:hypothetical protein VKT23_018504 [Stygiomarasmius scandens]|uniref:Uncharacterized protein n=1 Tax=Marasmiellus scandens TaxID=2682957 RepID=A0ABR1IQM2_9AGAR
MPRRSQFPTSNSPIKYSRGYPYETRAHTKHAENAIEQTQEKSLLEVLKDEIWKAANPTSSYIGSDFLEILYQQLKMNGKPHDAQALDSKETVDYVKELVRAVKDKLDYNPPPSPIFNLNVEESTQKRRIRELWIMKERLDELLVTLEACIAHNI